MTIYDWLTRQGIGWRVYESHPSVTMLRMFARYAGDNTNIVSLDRLQADVAAGNLPAFTAIEPAMHHQPQDDDHPPADMYRGQLFLKRVYDTLRSNPAIWQKTMLIITYDGHGGLYDHVIPPIADILEVEGGVVTPKPGAPFPQPTQAPTKLRIPYGVRVPTFVVSPWTTRGKGPSLTLDHCSILKTVVARFGGGAKPFISHRVHASQSFNAFLPEAAPRMDVPPPKPLKPLPAKVQSLAKGVSAIVTNPLSRKAMREGQVDYHDLTGWWARQLGR
jgi:phospholipase C